MILIGSSGRLALHSLIFIIYSLLSLLPRLRPCPIPLFLLAPCTLCLIYDLILIIFFTHLILGSQWLIVSSCLNVGGAEFVCGSESGRWSSVVFSLS